VAPTWPLLKSALLVFVLTIMMVLTALLVNVTTWKILTIVMKITTALDLKVLLVSMPLANVIIWKMLITVVSPVVN